jgi:hypothetical protein
MNNTWKSEDQMNSSQDLFVGLRNFHNLRVTKTRDCCCIVDSVMFSYSIEIRLKWHLMVIRIHMQAEMGQVDADYEGDSTHS